MLNNQERKGVFAQCNDSVALLKINARIYKKRKKESSGHKLTAESMTDNAKNW
jgi:hypothetical protein